MGNGSARLRVWLRGLALVGMFGAGLLCAAWPGVVFLLEHAAPFAGAPLPACGGTIADERYARAAREARDHLQALMVKRQIPGRSAAVAVGGRIIWSEAFGWADRERQIPACPETRFRVASLSKSFTAAAMAPLFE